MTARSVFTNIDFDNDQKAWSLPMENITAANHDGQIVKVLDIETAVNAVCDDSLVQYDVVARSVPDIVAPPALGSIQTKTQWLVTYHYVSDSAVIRHISIPCADLSGAWAIVSDGETIMDPTSAEYIALKAALEALLTEDDGAGTCVVDSIKFRE